MAEQEIIVFFLKEVVWFPGLLSEDLLFCCCVISFVNKSNFFL